MIDYDNKQMSDYIDQYIHSERDRKVLKLRLLDNVKFDSIAEQMNYSPRHIKRIYYKAVHELFRMINEYQK